MPKKNNSKITFKQEEIINTWIRLGGTNTANKFSIIQNESLDEDLSNSLSYGLVTEFLMNAANNESIEYINEIKNQMEVINKRNYIRQNTIDFFYLKARKEHAIALFNKYLINIIKVQGIYDFSSHIADFKIDFEIPALSQNEEFNSYLDKLYQFSNKKNPNRNSLYWNEFNEKSHVLMKKYYQGIFSSHQEFEKSAGREIANSLGFKHIKEFYSESNEQKNKLKNNLSLYDIVTFLDISRCQIQRDALNTIDNALINHGISPRISTSDASDFFSSSYLNQTTINTFLDEIYSIKEPKFYYLFSTEHAMALTVEKDNVINKFIYKFFDPNNEVTQHDDYFEFRTHLKKMIRKFSLYYGFKSLKDDDYQISFREYTLTPETRTVFGLDKVNQNDIDITASTLLAQKKIKLKLDKYTSITFDKFDKDSKILTVSLEKLESRVTIYTDKINIYELKSLLSENTKIAETYHDKLIFLSQDEYKLYEIDNIEKISEIKNNTLDSISDKSSTQLSENLDDFFQQDIPVISIPNQELPTLIINDDLPIESNLGWIHPIENPKLIPQHTAEKQLRLDESDYEHNIIFQLQNDPDNINKISVRMIGKHPKNTTLVLFDIINNQYEVVYGDVNRAVKGKTRWFIAGHGRFKKNKPTSFAQLSPQQLVDGLANIKSKLITLQQPDKIVLGGCRLAAGNIYENFARNTVELFSQKGFNVPIVAYSEVVYTEIDGSKHMHSRLNARTDEFRKVYSWDEKKQRILINNEAEILFLIDKLRDNEIDLNTFIRENQPVLSPYFENEQGKIDQYTIKKIAYNKNGYQIFQELINQQKTSNDETIYRQIVDKLKREGIDKVPLCQIIDSEHIETKSEATNKNINSAIDIIFRIKDSESIRDNVEQLVLKNPNSTIVFQVDVTDHQIYLEYGNIEQLKTTDRQSWKIVDSIDSEESFSGIYSLMLSNGLSFAKSMYNLKNPENIDIISTNKNRKPYYLNESLALANDLLVRLAEKNIHSNIYLDSYNNPNNIIINDNFINKTNFSYNASEKIAYINGEHPAKYIISDIVKKNLLLIDLDLFDYNCLVPYLSNTSGSLDSVKSLLIINDPFINIDINTYFSERQYLEENSVDKWDAIFKQTKNKDLKQKAVDTLFLLDAIDKNINIITSLGTYSTELLSDIFPKDKGYHTGDILRLVTQPEKLATLQGEINAFIGLELDRDFDGVSLSEALNKSKVWNDRISNNFLTMQKITHNTDASTRVSFINHGFYFAENTNRNKEIKDTLSQIYVYCRGSALPKEEFDFITIINYAVALNTKKQTIKLSASEELFLNFYQDMIFNLMKDIQPTQDVSLESSIRNHSFRQWLKEAKPSAYKIQTPNGDFTLIFKKIKGNYQYSIFDTDGLEASYLDKNQDKVLDDFTEHMIQYLNNKNNLTRDRPYSEENEQSLTSDDYQVNIQPLEQNERIQQLIHDKLNKLAIPQQKLTNMLDISGITLPLATLSRLGATIDDIPLNQQHLTNPLFYKRIRFDAETLSSRLTFVDGNNEDITLVKILKVMMANRENRDLIYSKSDIVNYSNLLQQLDYVDHYIDLEEENIDRQLWRKLQHIGIKSPFYVEIMHRTGQALNTVGFITLLTSTYGMMQQLDDPNLTDSDRTEIHKNLGIAWASGIINLSDLAQPALLKIAYQQTHSFKAAGTLAGHISIGLILAGIGFDIYNAYENFSKLSTEKDRAIHQDLIVNGNLSLAGIGIGIASIFGMIGGVAAAGPFGIIAGTVLMFAGMIYNAIRVTNSIKAQISLTATEEFTTGARAALGLPPVISVQNKLRKNSVQQAMEEAEWNYDRQFFINSILPTGFDTHIYTEERILSNGEDAYYLIDDDGNYFGGTLQIVGFDQFLLSLGLINDNETIKFYSKINARLFSKHEAEYFLQRSDLLDPSGHIYHDSNKKMADIYKMDKAELKIYPNENKLASNEVIVLNPNYKNPLLFNDFSLPQNNNTQITLSSAGSKTMKSYSLNESGLDKKHKSIVFDSSSFDEIDSIGGIEGALNKVRKQKGFSFNTGNGDDIIIGSQSEKNSFQIHDGAKFFAGGDKNDLFYYLSHDQLIYEQKKEHSFNIKPIPKKHFDGLDGEDTLILGSIIDRITIEVDLIKGELRHKSPHKIDVIATIENIENVIGHLRGNEIIYGNEKNNYLDSSGGKVELYGNSGDDKLFLDQGYANGGIGKDYYFIRNYKWSHYTNGLLIQQKHRSENNKPSVSEIVYNKNFQFHEGYNSDSHIIIDESNKDYSIVELDYSLEHINSIEIKDNDLHLIIAIPPYHITQNTLSSDIYNNSTQKIILKNAYINSIDSLSKMNHHQYTIKTKDGFILSSRLNYYLNNRPAPKVLVNIHYDNNQDKYQSAFYNKQFSEKNKLSMVTDIYADVENRALTFISIGKTKESIASIIFERKYIAPNWGEFIYSGSTGKFNFSGDDGNNTATSIGYNSYIYASRGNDYFYISQMNRPIESTSYQRISFDFSKLKYPNGYVGHNNNFNSNDKIILILENEDANELIMEGNTLYFGSKNNHKKSPIEFIHFQRDITDIIFIHDKNKNMFAVNLDSKGGSITWLNAPSFPTNSNDIIRISKGYITDKGVIDGKEGDDIITDISGDGHLINGGNGKNILTFVSGNNVIYGGIGNDELYGGSDDDLLIAAYGDDQLLGAKGNDYYLIDGDTIGDVTIDDNEGENKVYLMNFQPDYILAQTPGGSSYKTYTSFKGGSVNIIEGSQSTNKNITTISIDNTLKKRLENKLSSPTKRNIDNLMDTLIQNMANARYSDESLNTDPQSGLKAPTWSAISYFERLIH